MTFTRLLTAALPVGLALTGTSLRAAACDEAAAVQRARQVTDLIAELSGATHGQQDVPVRSDENAFYVTVMYDTGLHVPTWSVEVYKHDCSIGSIVHTDREG